MIRSRPSMRRMRIASVVALGLVAGLAAPARADRFIPMGARQRALGTAGVASTEDATAVYWNPANLGLVPLGRPPHSWGSSSDRKDGDAKSGARDERAQERDASRQERRERG